MYEFHGWIMIPEYEKNKDAVFEKIKQRIEEYAWVRGVLGITVVNASYHIYTSGYTNHKAQDADEVFELYQYVAKLSPRAYGLLYVWDDEDPNGLANEFQVFVLMRGKIHERRDPFLSPCIPLLDDPK
ncbi:hypothetical protein JQC72_15280 [Polycladomyces sp. WAk]|uniref:Immunity protein 7 of polymorphic toxin system n=1 Tax=Polycladomyces zharkentensis TaxID=2807616 RepID=A0ABS2WMW3_9BACL|nr:Imm7 family immunity protein [Polycladomyces sp. WAk]MBN2910861.1 hypothetical protein [Polycladomyces sp. WAk]